MLARHGAAEARTAVVTAAWADGTRRAAELADALRILGAGEPRTLGYADARAPQSAPGDLRFRDTPLDESVRRLVAHMREFRPDIVVMVDLPQGSLQPEPDQPDHRRRPRHRDRLAIRMRRLQ